MNLVQPIRTAPPSRDAYLLYMNSPEWRAKRNAKLREVGWRCERCASKRYLQVHHLSYANFRHELTTDLKALCANCHRDEHLERPDQTSLGLYLKLASEAVKANPWSSIADLSETVKLRCIALKVPLLPERVKSGLAVVCGRLKSSAAAIPYEATDLAAGLDRGGPLTREEARDVFYRQDTWLDRGLTALVQSKSMPQVDKTPDSQRNHEETIRQQREAICQSAPPPHRRSVSDQLKEIFQDGGLSDVEAV